MPSISIPVAIAGSAAIGAGASLIGSSNAAGAAKSAANTQASAENNAANMMQQQYQQTRADLAPFSVIGQDATQVLANLKPFDFQPTQAQLEATPGYQFTRNQGLKATQNGYAAQGLGSSGAAIKGGADFATGLASGTYQNQFGNALNAYLTNAGILQDLTHTGESAAAQTGNFGTTTAANIGQTAVGAANASAAGTVGSANAFNAGLSGVTGNISNAFLSNAFFNNPSAGGSIYSPYPGQAGYGGGQGQDVGEFY